MINTYDFKIIDIDLTDINSILNQAIEPKLWNMFEKEIQIIFDFIKQGKLTLVNERCFIINESNDIKHTNTVWISDMWHSHLFEGFSRIINNNKTTHYISGLKISTYVPMLVDKNQFPRLLADYTSYSCNNKDMNNK